MWQNSQIRVITKLPNSEQAKVKTHKYINRQNQQQLRVISLSCLFLFQIQIHIQIILLEIAHIYYDRRDPSTCTYINTTEVTVTYDVYRMGCGFII